MSVDHRRRLGMLGEQIAAEHLQRRGLLIIERNFRTRWGELDIIALDGDTLVFCEVKTRSANGSTVEPLESVHVRKRRQVRRIAGQWLAQRPTHPRAGKLRFDAVGVTVDANGTLQRLSHLEGAF